MRPHIVLLGDSVFENAAYVTRGDDVLQQLRNALPGGWRATMNARDGAVIDDVRLQLERLPGDATHLFVSAGGNDALGNAAVLARPVTSVSGAMDLLSAVRTRFAERYAAMLDEALRLDLPTMICTIYDARFPDPDQRRIASTALCVLNDLITREAASRGLPIADLRVLFNDDADFANAIEPSGQGSRKIARAVIQIVEDRSATETGAAWRRWGGPPQSASSGGCTCRVSLHGCCVGRCTSATSSASAIVWWCSSAGSGPGRPTRAGRD